MIDEAIVQLSAYPGWIVGVSYDQLCDGYLCWVIDPNFNVLSDGRNYETSHAAMMMGRAFVESHINR